MSSSKKRVTHARSKPRAKRRTKTRQARPKAPAAAPAPILHPSDAQAVLQKNVTNIVKKAATGKTLSKSELATIGQFSSPGTADVPPQRATEQPASSDWVSSYAALAAAFGCHDHSFPRWKKNHQDAPKPRQNGDHSIAAWRAFFEAHPEINIKASAGPGKAELEIEKLREQCRRIKFENDLREGDYLKKADVNNWLIETIETVKAKLSTKLLNELPPKLEGLRAPEIAAKLEPMMVEICALLRFAHESK